MIGRHPDAYLNPLQHTKAGTRYLTLIPYWNGLRGIRPYPAETEIDPNALSELWDNCFLIALDTVTEREGISFSYLGHNLIEVMDEVSGKLPRGCLMGWFKQVLRDKTPVIGQDELFEKNQSIRYYCCMTPYGDASHITHVLGCLAWDEK